MTPRLWEKVVCAALCLSSRKSERLSFKFLPLLIVRSVGPLCWSLGRTQCCDIFFGCYFSSAWIITQPRLCEWTSRSRMCDDYGLCVVFSFCALCLGFWELRGVFAEAGRGFLGWLQLLPLTHLQHMLSSAPGKILFSSFLHSLPDCFQSSPWSSWRNTCHKTNTESHFRCCILTSQRHAKAVPNRRLLFSLFLEDTPLLSFVASHIPRFFVRLKKKKEERKWWHRVA